MVTERLEECLLVFALNRGVPLRHLLHVNYKVRGRMPHERQAELPLTTRGVEPHPIERCQRFV